MSMLTWSCTTRCFACHTDLVTSLTKMDSEHVRSEAGSSTGQGDMRAGASKTFNSASIGRSRAMRSVHHRMRGMQM